MKNKIYSDPLSPYETKQRKRTLDMILWVTLVMSIPLASTNFIDHPHLNPTGIVVILLIPICLLGLFLNKKGYYKFAGGMISFWVLFAILFDIVEAGGFMIDLAAVAFPVFIAICGLLFGKRGIYLFSSITILSIIVLAYFELSGMIPGAKGSTDITDVSTVIVLLIGMAVILWVIMDNHNKNMKTIQKDEADLLNSYELTLESLAKALDFRDKETETHSQRVVEMSNRLGKALNLSEVDHLNIKRGALLHDIGKIAIPDSILLKPGPLNDDEWIIMRQHPAKGLELLHSIPFLINAVEIPYCHHEAWDGSGYPRGLKGEEIPLHARIFTIVDQWEALTSDRPYRKAWPYEKVIEYIREKRGVIYDPQITDVFLDLIAKDPSNFINK